MQIFVTYFRVSTDKQGLTGLGMDAQREAVARYVHNRGHVISEYTEVESGRKDNRPQLTAALDECRRSKAVLLIARLDRLARNVAFIANLMNSDVEFVAVDMPQANRLTIHILAAVAEHEREMISQRTRAALAAAKVRGVKLGNPHYKEALSRARAALERFPLSDEVAQLLLDWRRDDYSLRAIASRLNALNIPTSRGNKWHASTVSAALDRFDLRMQPLNDAGIAATPSVFTPNAGRGAKTEGVICMQNLDAAYRMLDTFTSVGARRFDVTFLGINGEKRGFRPQQSAAQLRNSLPKLLPGLTERQNSLVVRPVADEVLLVQLDDLDAVALERLHGIAFLTLATSPGNHQAWVAVSGVAGVDGKDLARRLRKGVAADVSASGATRVAGTVNYKEKYAPAFPTVALVAAYPGRVVTAENSRPPACLPRRKFI